MGVDVQRDLCVLMAGQILNGLDVNPGKQQVSDVGVPELVGRHMEINAIHHGAVMCGPLP